MLKGSVSVYLVGVPQYHQYSLKLIVTLVDWTLPRRASGIRVKRDAGHTSLSKALVCCPSDNLRRGSWYFGTPISLGVAICCMNSIKTTTKIKRLFNPEAQWLLIIISRMEGLMCGINRYMGDYGMAGLKLPKLCVWPVLTTKVTKKWLLIIMLRTDTKPMQNY